MTPRIQAMRYFGRKLFVRCGGRVLSRRTRCLFVLSTGRCGTTTLTKLLNLSPEVDAYHERKPKLVAPSLDAFYDGFEQRTKYARVFEEAHCGHLTWSRLRRRVYSDTSNRLTYFAPAIAAEFPNAKFIHLHRHPVDVLRSGMRRGWYQNSLWDPYRVRPAIGTPAHLWWDQCDRFSKICWYWSAINEFALRLANEIEPSRFMEVRFDEIAKKESERIGAIFDFIDVDRPPNDHILSVLTTPYNKQTQGYYPPPAEWTRTQMAQLEEIAGATSRRLGYALRSSHIVESF